MSDGKYTGKGYTKQDWDFAKRNLSSEPFRKDLHNTFHEFGKNASRLYMEKLRHETFYSDSQRQSINLANGFEDEVILRLFLQDVIQSLTNIQRERYLLHAEGYLLREIASMQNVSINAISKSIIKAREKILNILKKFYFEG
ncbi:hypothetical protein LJC56_09385 [Christensenellaceae bacterium OttesenSCG-928-K19]|nr:hypothetical protein [Christensenellaceae bacterium OttesenSCG-928-K19]